MLKSLCISAFCIAALATPIFAQSPFADALALWHMADPKDSTNTHSNLTPTGNVTLGLDLPPSDRQASLARGGDGRAAQFAGGYLDAGQGANNALNPHGKAFTLCARLRDPSGNWMAPLFSKHGGHDTLVYNLFSHDFGQGKVIGFELGTDRTPGMTQVTVPLALIGATDWHDIICRYDGAKLQLFVDGVCMDEGFPIGSLRQTNREPCLIGAESANGSIKSGWRGLIDHVALWSRALSDAEIETLSGGAAEVNARRTQYLGSSLSMQYFRPHNQFNVGDTLPFFHDGTFHFYYLQDRGHHTAKGGQGAHQWAHASSRDLIHWTQHPLAVPITQEIEGSICTGSMFFHAGTYYAFYATRMIARGEHLSLATGADGIHFAKTDPNPFLSPGPKYTNGFRDPHVFLDEQTGLFHLLVSTMLKDPNRGCLAHYTSSDLKQWKEVDPFLIEGTEVPECPDYFRWNGWYYLLFSNGQVAHYRMSQHPLGPWQRPKMDVIDGSAARVMKTAPFTGNRRIGTASIWPHGYAGWAIFRELVQFPDGTLGSKFVPEMIPPTAAPVPLTLKSPINDPGTSKAHGAAVGNPTPLAVPGNTVSGDPRQLNITSPKGITEATLTGLPKNTRLRLRIDAKAKTIGLRLGTQELRFTPAQRRVSVTNGPSLSDVAGLDQPFSLDLILKDNILDLCINNQRTLVAWLPTPSPDQLTLFVETGQATFLDLTANPLR